MEVTHNDDQVTHAVIGGSDKIDFTIEDNGFFMHMLSASLYKDQRMAVVREVLCNADDAHKENNVVVPFEVTLTSEKLIIRDFGPGIPHDMIGKVYGTYGGSTKRDSTKATGGFGLGCKSPFAYTDNFQVTSYCNGVKTIYRMSKSDAEVGGKPSIIKILSVPTSETGLEVNINIAERRDVDLFAKRIQMVLANGEMNARFNGVKAKVLPFSLMEHGYMITDHEPLLEPHPLLVRYGAVLYPIPTHEDYASVYWTVTRSIGSLGKDQDQLCGILQAPPGSLSLTPSREALTLTPQTIETISELLSNFARQWNGGNVDLRKDTYFTAIGKMATRKDVKALFSTPERIDNYAPFVESVEKSDGHYYIANQKALADWQVLKEYPGKRNQPFQLLDLRTRVQHLVKIHEPQHSYDRGLMRTYLKALKKPTVRQAGLAARENFKRRVIAPVQVELLGKKWLNKYSLHVIESRHGWMQGTHSYYSNYPALRSAATFAAENYDSYFLMCHRTIVLTHDTVNVLDKLRWNSGAFGYEATTQFAGMLVLETGRAKAKVEEARAVLEVLRAKGYKIVDLTLSVEYRAPVERKKSDKPKLVGYAALCGVRAGASFEWNYITKTDYRIEKPEAYAVLFSKSSGHTTERFAGFDRDNSAAIADMYGDVIAATINSGQIDKFDKEGVPSVEQWLPGKIEADLVANKTLLAALPGTYRVLRAWALGKDIPLDFLKLLVTNEQIAKELKVPVLTELNNEQSQLFTIFRKFASQFPELEGSVIGQTIKNMEPSKKLKAFASKLSGNTMLNLVSVSEVKAVFEGDDEVLKEKTLKLIKQILKG